RRVNSATPLKPADQENEVGPQGNSSPSELGDPIEAPSSSTATRPEDSSSPSELGDPIEAGCNRGRRNPPPRRSSPSELGDPIEARHPRRPSCDARGALRRVNSATPLKPLEATEGPSAAQAHS